MSENPEKPNTISRPLVGRGGGLALGWKKMTIDYEPRLDEEAIRVLDDDEVKKLVIRGIEAAKKPAGKDKQWNRMLEGMALKVRHGDLDGGTARFCKMCRDEYTEFLQVCIDLDKQAMGEQAMGEQAMGD